MKFLTLFVLGILSFSVFAQDYRKSINSRSGGSLEKLDLLSKDINSSDPEANKKIISLYKEYQIYNEIGADLNRINSEIEEHVLKTEYVKFDEDYLKKLRLSPENFVVGIRLEGYEIFMDRKLGHQKAATDYSIIFANTALGVNSISSLMNERKAQTIRDLSGNEAISRAEVVEKYYKEIEKSARDKFIGYIKSKIDEEELKLKLKEFLGADLLPNNSGLKKVEQSMEREDGKEGLTENEQEKFKELSSQIEL